MNGSTIFTVQLESDIQPIEQVPRPLTLDLFEANKLAQTIETPSTSQTPQTPQTPSSINSQTRLVNHHSNPVSTGRTLVYLIKGNLGPGLFAIPAAFRDAGLVGGSIGIPFMAILSIHCMHMLVSATKVLKTRLGDPDMSMDYPQAIETAFLTGPAALIGCAKIARKIIKVSLFLKELAFCSVFLLFAGNYLLQLISFFYPDCGWTLGHWTALVSILALGMASIRNHHHLHILSYVASGIKLFSLVVLFVFVFQDLPSVSERPAFSTPAYMLLYYGTVIFAFEGVTQVLPLHDNMRTTVHFRSWNGVLNTGMILIGCLYFTLGFYGYLKYGDYTYPSITMNLPKDRTVCQVVKVGLIVALIINYGIQFHAALEITEPSIQRYFPQPCQRKLANVAVRLFIFATTVCVAMITENLDLFLSLAGALTCTLICLVFPPALDTITFWKNIGYFRLTKNALIILLGIFAFTTGTVVAAMALNNYYDFSASGEHH